MAVQGAACDIQLRFGILITPEYVRMIHGNTTKWQINYDQQLFIEGQWIRLEVHEQALLRKFSEGLRQEVPEIVGIAMEGATIGQQALNSVIGGVSKVENEELFSVEFDSFKARFKQKFNHVGDLYYISPQNLNELGNFFEQELGEEIKNMVSNSLGAVLLALGDAISATDDGSERHVVAVSKQLELLEVGVEKQLQVKSVVLKQKAKQFCHRLTQLNRTESELHVMLPQLRRYNLIKMR